MTAPTAPSPEAAVAATCLGSPAAAPQRPYLGLRQALADSMLLIRLRWRMVRSRKSRVGVAVGSLFVLGMLWAAASAGSAVRRLAESGTETAAADYAVTFLVALDAGELGGAAAAALATALAAALIAPFSGSTNTSLFAVDDLTCVRPHRLHRLFDSIFTTAVSMVAVLQLFTLTVVAALLSIDGNAPLTIVVTWLVWPPLMMVTVVEGWFVEIAHRRYGRRARRIAFLGLVTVLGVAVIVDPNNGRTLFGLGNAYATSLRAVASGDLGAAARLIAVGAVIAAALFVIAAFAARYALQMPAAVSSTGATERLRPTISERPYLALVQVTLLQMARTPAVRRPMLALLLVGVPGIWYFGYVNYTASTFVIGATLGVSLAFGVNAFGIYGPSMTWLASHPAALTRMLTVIFTTQMLVTFALFTIIWGPPLITGRVPLHGALTVATGTYVAAMMTTRSATTKAVTKPYTAKLTERSDVIVPPLTSVNYTLRFALWSGQFGVAATVIDTAWVKALLVGLVTVFVALRMIRLRRRWADPQTRARVIAIAAAD